MSPIAISDSPIPDIISDLKAKLNTQTVDRDMPAIDKLNLMPSTPEPLEPVFGRKSTDADYVLLNQPLGTRRRLRVIGIGAGASGINMAYKIQAHLKDVDFVAYEKNDDVGGTWLENRYPGCACDTNSHTYAFTWYPNPNWSTVYSESGEIQAYMKDVCDHFGLHKYIRLHHEILGATWHEDLSKWSVRIRKNSDSTTDFTDWCDVLINGSGLLNHWKWPSIPGLEDYKGTKIHTASWPQGLDLAGKKVGLIGVGSSSVQVLPQVQKVADKVTIFIRSKTWIAPRAPNEPYPEEEIKMYRENPDKHLAYRKAVEHTSNLRFKFIIRDSVEQAEMAADWTKHMKETLKNRPDIIENLIPDFGVGCRRPTPGPGFLEALQADNVEAVFSSVTSCTPTGVTTAQGNKYDFDVLICATGFDVSFKPRFPIIGRNGVDLRDQWADGAEAYLSMFTTGFPNYISVLGPGAPSAQGSIIVSTERISDYIIRFLQRLQTEPILTFTIRPSVVKELAEHTEAQLATTVWADSCSSWFKNGTKDGKIRALHPGGRLHFFAAIMNPRYEDFDYTYSNNRFAHWGNGYALREVENRDITWYLDYKDGMQLFEY